MKHPNKILSMTDFVEWLRRFEQLEWRIWEEQVSIIRRYAKLLQTPLSLEMFVAVKDGKVLEEPGSAPIYTHSKEYIKKYKQAHQKILFEGWERDRSKFDNFAMKKEGGTVDFLEMRGTIEKLASEIPNIKLTKNFWNQIFKP